MRKYILGLIGLLSVQLIVAQADQSPENLEEVVITSERIELPFSENSRTITIINGEEIKNSTATNVADLLQNVAGIDVRRRGIDGMQSDIYIRGGHFNQTLVLIDGIKVEDPQTGHHTMNVMIPLENIARIEIIKGPAARVYGQNAFLGAINIVTKNAKSQKVSIQAKGGSFERLFLGANASVNTKKASHIISFSDHTSDGYRPNTDFKNRNYFIKSLIDTKKNPISVLATFQERKFGANNFYTNNPSFNEYEETQTSVVGISTRYKTTRWTFKPALYWKRNQDMFLLKREDPSFSRNFNISNKVGGQLNSFFTSKLGTTGLGVDIAQVSLSSNNLGNQNRTMITSFIENRFLVADNKLDITPGVSVNYFSDFKFQAFPGIDIGYTINDFIKMYGNVGYSYRIPTYTEMYINIPNFLSGNENLKPEKAFAQEVGFKYTRSKINFSTAFFRRASKDLIDYIKETETSPLFVAKNIRKITTIGFEVNTQYNFEVNDLKQIFKLGYTFLEDDYHNTNVFASRYLLNSSIKHQVVASANFTFIKHLQGSLSYRYVERPTNSYNVVDASLQAKLADFTLSIIGNNIFNTSYVESANIPMPKGNVLMGLTYVFK